MDMDLFHPAVATWFADSFPAATSAQARAWPAIQAGRHTLVAAPTGSGKTLAAFLAAIDALVRQSQEEPLPDEVQVVYVSPLKALSNDIQRNLEAPLAGIEARLEAMGSREAGIRTLVRTGDTPAGERERMRRRPPHILVTTPESLYILLTAESGRRMLAGARTVIVDEIHAVAQTKRGAHLALSLERLDALAGRRLTRIGLSATQRPVEEVARFLVGENAPCTIIDEGHGRKRDLALELPASPLSAIMAGEVWSQVYDRLAELIRAHRTTLVFVNTRRLAERVARQLSERLGEENVTAHHGSLAREQRLAAEQRLKQGKLQALVATASLELGIDIGDVELVCQLGSTRSISAFLQRVGRSGHAVGGIAKGRLFPLSRDELVECAALLDAVRRGELDAIHLPSRPLDVLAQQIVAEVACREWDEEALFQVLRAAYPYRDLTRAQYTEVVRMLSEGVATRLGRRAAHLHRDTVQGRLRARRGARLSAITNGGTIPDNADYNVVMEPQGQFIGTVNEDFAVESLAGDIFQLGNTSYRILRVEAGTLRVEDAHGQPPGIPFWLGEAPGRSDELSAAVSRMRSEISARLDAGGSAAAERWLLDEVRLSPPAATQVVEYLAAAKAALGALPTQQTVIFERFFDEAGGMQLVVHSPYGSRLNRAWGLSLRKRFCRKFNFELQAAADENAIVLSLTTTHSFPLEEVARYLHPSTVRPLLVQALLAAPMFVSRWRWVATVALALSRFRGGRKVPPPLQRMDAEDLIAAVFPDQLACAENLAGEREVPEHPLVDQTLADCLQEAMDVGGLERLLTAMEAGDVQVLARDVTEPSPLALEILGARPYSYLDDAPLEERRTQAVIARRWLDPETADDLGRLDPEAIQRVREEAWPRAASADEVHDALTWMDYLTEVEAAALPDWSDWLQALGRERRAARLPMGDRPFLWIAAERLPLFRALFPDARLDPPIEAPAEFAAQAWTPEDALRDIVRGRLEALGPVTVQALAEPLAQPTARVEAALAALETEGFAMRGRFTPGAGAEWCERRLLARIHRYTVKRLREEIEPVSGADFLRFLFRWQHVAADARQEGRDALLSTIGQLEAYEAPAAAWEAEILPARIADYDPAWLDELTLTGRIAWRRLAAREAPEEGSAVPVRATPIVLLPRRSLAPWAALTAATQETTPRLGSRSQAVHAYLAVHGASFFEEIAAGTGLLRTQVEQALADLTALGLATADSYAGLRALLLPAERRRPIAGGSRRRHAVFGMEDAGRWTLVRAQSPELSPPSGEVIEHVVRTLLKRWGVVFWGLVAREAGWLPRWRDLLRVFRRLEARGEVRGGRFVAGVTSEQFALPEAVGLLRDVRRSPGEGALVAISAADPLNLVGSILPGQKIPALTGNRILFRDGVPLAVQLGRTVEVVGRLEGTSEWDVKNALVRRKLPPTLSAYLR